MACWQASEVLQQAAVVVVRAESDPKTAIALHLTVNQRQFQAQLARCLVAHVDLSEWKVVVAELPDLWVCHVPSSCQVVVAHQPLLEQVLQGLDPQNGEVVGEPSEVQEPKRQKVVLKVVLSELVEVSVAEPVRCDHVEVDAWLVLLPCRPYQVREWVVQDCLGGDEWELV